MIVIAVYDASGRMVDRIILEGTRSVIWGSSHEPGIYFIREVNSDLPAQKVVLIR